jgi:hypothetical protein
MICSTLTVDKLKVIIWPRWGFFLFKTGSWQKVIRWLPCWFVQHGKFGDGISHFIKQERSSRFNGRLICLVAHGEMYSIQHYVITFVSDLRQVGGFLRVLRFPSPIKLPPHNIIESGVKRHNTNPLIWIARENTLYWTNIMTCKFHKPITRIKLHVLLLITMTNCFQWLHMGVKCPSIYTINGFLFETRNEKRNK